MSQAGQEQPFREENQQSIIEKNDKGRKMKENKVRCTRCKAEVSVRVDAQGVVMRNLGWMDLHTYYSALNDFTLCPHCAHELKRFLAGCEIKKLPSG